MVWYGTLLTVTADFDTTAMRYDIDKTLVQPFRTASMDCMSGSVEGSTG